VSTGHLVYATQEGSLVASQFDPRRLRVTGAPVSLLEGLLVKASGAAEFTVSPAGTLAYLGGQTSGRSLMLVGRTGTERLIGRELLGLAAPRFSPDGRRIAVEVLEQRSVAIRVLDVGRGTISRLTFEGQARYPEWTPDGRRIGFAWSKAGTQAYDLFEVAADGSREPQPLLAAENAQWEISYSPRAPLAIYRESHPLTRRDLWVLPLDSPRVPRPYLRSSFEERAPAVSPDGRWVAYTSDESSVDEVYVRAFPEPTGRWQISVNGGTEPQWSRDGRTLFYRTADSLVAVDVRSGPTLEVGQRRSLFAASYQRSAQHADYDVSPDGSQFVFVKSGPDAANLVVVINWFDDLRRRMTGSSQEAAP
jgi:Tol biopolymer transport system component